MSTTSDIAMKLRVWAEDEKNAARYHESGGSFSIMGKCEADADLLYAAASRLSEMDAENKRLRELLAEALEALTPFAAQSRASGPTEERNIRRARAAADKIRAGVKEGEA